MANKVIQTIRRVARKRREPANAVKAAYETGRVESNFSNPSGGDADSAGWRQERARFYRDPTNLRASVNRFFDEADKLNRGQKSYDLAAEVQRPAAQYRGRYKTASKEAQGLLKGGGAGGRSGSPPRGAQTASQGAQTASRSAARRAALQAYVLGQGSADPDSLLLDLAQGLSAADKIPAKATASKAPDARTALRQRRSGRGGRAISPHARAGDPVVSSKQSVGGQHETEGLPGYPAHDYFAPAGTHAVAPVSGKVVKLSGHDPAQGPVEGPHGPLGWSVYIQGKDGRTYYLTHMGSRNVKVGQTVKQGQVIGTVADYDKYGTPSHIHMGVNG